MSERKSGSIGIAAEPGSRYQLRLPFDEPIEIRIEDSGDVKGKLSDLLNRDLTFRGERTNYASHNIHAFAAKFPPQLPRLFINELTRPGERVLDPMVGSGTTLVEAVLAGREGIGIDLDPLALIITKVKSTAFDLPLCVKTGIDVLRCARRRFRSISEYEIRRSYSDKAMEFFRYWFEERVIYELYALADTIRSVENPDVRTFLEVVFSSIIITKTGGVSRARDLAHTRPHRDINKKIRGNVFDIFWDRMISAIQSLEDIVDAPGTAYVIQADARRLPLASESVHLIVTSPPYVANAIDYMRAHKFSLIWLGYEPEDLTDLRRRYIGAELRYSNLDFPSEICNNVLRMLKQRDERRAEVVAYYFHDMEVILREMLRVTAKGSPVILVVGSSTIRGVKIQTPVILAEIASSIGFHLIGIAKREIIRDARMMPVSRRSQRTGIEARMHEEGVICLIKP
ncbi:MAG: DNA methyltransferase [Candidatus Syntropharchaeales archaeon]